MLVTFKQDQLATIGKGYYECYKRTTKKPKENKTQNSLYLFFGFLHPKHFQYNKSNLKNWKKIWYFVTQSMATIGKKLIFLNI